MIRVRYTEWDGTQRNPLDADRLFESLAENLSETHDVQQALDWLLRHGLDLQGGMHLVGLEELLDQVRSSLRSNYGSFDLNSVGRDLRNELNELLELEQDALREAPAGSDAEAKQSFLSQLPSRVSEALDRLRDYSFEDSEAAARYQDLLASLDEIRALEQFLTDFGELFHGREPLDREGALELMKEVARLKELEEQLVNGDLDGLDMDLVADVLGVDAVQQIGSLGRILSTLKEGGYLVDREGQVKLSPKAIRKIGQLALRDMYQDLLRDRAGAHGTDARGAIDVRPERTTPYEFGDPMHLDLIETLRNGLRRNPTKPLQLAPEDFAVFDTDHATSTSTVFLLDMSWSMSWDGRFSAAKRVAMAMESLIRTRYPRDFFAIVGFFTRAVELKLADLPEASWNMGDPFTNLQEGLRLATEILGRRSGVNKQIVLITDGQPTAYQQGGRLHCEWPLSFGGISLRAAQETLREVERVTRHGIVINTFMLDDSPALRAFVDRMTRINKGRAFYTRPDRLGEYLLVDYIAKKRRRV